MGKTRLPGFRKIKSRSVSAELALADVVTVQRVFIDPGTSPILLGPRMSELICRAVVSESWTESPIAGDTIKYSVRIPQTVYKRLKSIAESLRRPIGSVAGMCLRDSLTPDRK